LGEPQTIARQRLIASAGVARSQRAQEGHQILLLRGGQLVGEDEVEELGVPRRQ
jgi:hypothetical protein